MLVAINWMHDVPADELEAIMTPALTRSRYLLIDRIAWDTPLEYPFHHDFTFLEGLVEED